MPESELIKVSYRGQEHNISIKRQVGDDHLILFLHGLGCAKESFDGAFRATSLRKYSICTMDFLGFGASDKPDTFTYVLEDQAAVVEQVIKNLAPKELSIVAHSMGGAIGVLLADKVPTLDHFIDVEGNLVAEDCGLVSRGTADQTLQAFEQVGFNDFLNILTSSERPDFQAWAVWYKAASPRALHASAKSMVEWSDSDRLLTRFNALHNKAYVYGDEESKEYLLPRLRSTSIVYIPKLKHFMMVENPKLFFDTIAKTLAV